MARGSMNITDTINTEMFRFDKADSKWLGIEGASIRGVHLWAEVRWQCFSSSETLHKESFPVWVFMLYACRADHKNHQQPLLAAILQYMHWFENSGSLLGGTRGLLLEAHHPTGCTSGIQRLHQKSLLVSPSKPSYRSRALKPGQHKTHRNQWHNPYTGTFLMKSAVKISKYSVFYFFLSFLGDSSLMNPCWS